MRESATNFLVDLDIFRVPPWPLDGAEITIPTCTYLHKGKCQPRGSEQLGGTCIVCAPLSW